MIADFLGEAFFEVGLGVGLGGVGGPVIEEAFALETAGGEAGEGVKHAEIVEGVGGKGVAEGVRTAGQGFGDLRGSDLLNGLEAVDVAGLAEEVEGAVGAGTAFVEEAQLAEVVLVAASLPAADVFGPEAFTVVTKLLDDLAAGEAVVEQLVNAVADGFGAAGDFTVMGATIFDFCHAGDGMTFDLAVVE